MKIIKSIPAFYKHSVITMILIFGAPDLFAQNPSLEFAAAGTSTSTNGPTIANQVVTFQKNTNNPTGNTFVTQSPARTVTYSLTNQQRTTAAAPNVGVMFGANGATASSTAAPLAIYQTIDAIGSANATHFRSWAGTSTSGSEGLATNRNYGIEVFTSTRPLYESNEPLPVAGAPVIYQMADLVLSFNAPVNNPIIHLAGLGGAVGSGGNTPISTELVLLSSGLTLTRLSGSGEFSVPSNTEIRNSATTFAAGTGSGGASGSVRVNGTNITSITFRIFLKAQSAGTRYWSINANSHSGDGFIVSVSVGESDLSVNKIISNSTPSIGSNVTFTITASNKGVSNNTGVTVQDLLPSGYTYVSHTASNGNATYNPTTGLWNIGVLNDGVSHTLTITATVLPSGNYTNIAQITTNSNIGDPNLSNNSASVTPNVPCVLSASNPDSDGDGIPDDCDLDDDNDGILDKDECVGFIANNVNGPWKGRTASNITVSATPSTTQTNSLVVTTDPQVNFSINQNGGDQRFGNSATATSYVLTFSTPVPANEIGLMIDDVNVLPNRSPNAAFKIDVDFGTGFTDPQGTFIKTMAGRNSGVGYNAITGVPSFQDLPNPDDLGGEDIYLRGAGTTLVNAVRITGSNLGGSADAISYSFFALSPCDTDGDGIPNDLDLDSDNDGCPDAIEGAANLTTLVDSSMPGGNTGASSGTFNQPVIQNLGNAVNTTVGSASYGVPTIAGTGQAVGTSATANPVLAAGTAVANQVIQSGTAPATLTLTGATGTIQWQISDNNTTFANVTTGTGATTANYSPASITATRYYRAVVTSAGGCIAFSNIITITVCNAGTASPNFNNYNSTGATYSRTNSTYNILCGAGETANLSVLVPSPAVPSGTIVTWHSASPATDANRINPVTAVTGATRKVYAAFFDSTNSCYSPTREVTIYGPICAADDDYTATPILYGVPTTLPVSITANDTYLGDPVSAPNPNIVILEEYWNSAVVINPNGTLAFNTTSSILAPGIYSIYYKICDADPDAVSETNCSVGEVKFRIVSCTNPPNTDPATDFTKTGISTLEGFAGGTTGWPGNVPNGFIAIESRNKGFVITRVVSANNIPVADRVEGMLVYDITDACVKLYNGSYWKCLEKDCGIPTN